MGNSELRAAMEQVKSDGHKGSGTGKLTAWGWCGGCQESRAYLLLDAILNNCSPVQSQEAFLRQVPHQADNGLLAALGRHTFLLLLIHDHFLNPGVPQNKKLISPISARKAFSNPFQPRQLRAS